MAGQEDREIMKFLSKATEVETLIKDMTSGDPNLEKAAFEKADDFLEKNSEREDKDASCGFNKSVINKYERPEESSSDALDASMRFSEQSMSPETFLKQIEEDSERRRKKRAIDDEKSKKLKDLGNGCFKRGNYDDALKHYSDAIHIIRDNEILYTNRAQAYIHLNENESAIEDCTTALLLNKKCVKAYVHKGRAFQNLNRFDEAIGCFEKVCEINGKHKKLMRTYIEEVEKRREIYNKEQSALSLSKSKDESSTRIKKVIERLRRENTSIKGISELLCELKKSMTDDLYKVLFRTTGGFKIIFENSRLSRLLKSESLADKDDEECVFQIIDLLSSVCNDNEENILEVLHPTILLYLEKYSAPSLAFRIKSSTINLIHNITVLSKGRQFLLKDKNTGRKIIENSLSMLLGGGEEAVVALSVINNITLHDGLDKELLDVLVEQLIPFVVKMMEVLLIFDKDSYLAMPLLEVIPTSITTMGNLSRNVDIRSRLAKDEKLTTLAAQIMELYELSLTNGQKNRTVFSLLGLLINMFTGEAPCLDFKLAMKFYCSCVQLLKCDFPNVVERAAGLLSRLMPSCSELVKEIMKKRGYKTFLPILTSENEKAKDYIIKCIALCTSEPSTELIDDLMKTEVSSHLLALLKSNEERTIGNAALCISNCASNVKFSAKIESTGVIQDLLHIATNDLYQNKVKHNAAIAIGKLAKTNTKHLEKLRELHGLEILHEVLQANKDPNS